MSFKILEDKNRFVIDTYTNAGVRIVRKYVSANRVEDLIPLDVTNHNLSFVSRIEISSVGKDFGNK
jgi:hypothetical protein